MLIEYTDIPETGPYDTLMLAWYGYSHTPTFGSSWTWIYFW